MGIGTRWGMIAAAAVLVSGCAAIGLARLEPGKSTEADVRQVLGAPARVYSLPGGARQLAFPQGPAGTQTYMAYVTPDGRLSRVDQVLSDEHLQRIVPGSTTSEQLERLIGPPWRTIAFPNLRQVAWDYVIDDAWGYTVDLSVMVDERGIVAGTVYARRERGDKGDGGYK
jgi:hypothetical protein